MVGLLLGVLAFLQVQEFNITRYTVNDGLSNNIVYDVHQDQEGFIWVATENGLNKFDAYEFRTFYHIPGDSSSISNNVVRTIYEDEKGELWIGTRRGINHFNKTNEKFTHFPLPESFGIDNNDVHILRPDSRGRIWYIARSRLVGFDMNTKEFEEISLPFLVYAFVIDKDDTFWISGYEGGIYSYSIETGELEIVRNPKEDERFSFFLSRDRSILLFDGNESKTDIREWENLPELADNQLIYRFFEDSKRRRWFGTGTGLFLQEEFDENPEKYNLNGSSDDIHSNIKSILEDNVGGIWIGSVNGLYHLDATKKPIELLETDLPNKMVMAIEEVGDTWWVNYFAQELSKYRLNAQGDPELLESVRLPNGVSQIWDIKHIAKDRLWLATEQGLIELNPSTFSYNKIVEHEPIDQNEVLFIIKEAGEYDYWVGGYGILFRVDSRSNEIVQTIRFSGPYSGALVQDILVLEDGLLFATESFGLFSYSEELGMSRTWQGTDLSESFNQVSIWDLYVSTDGTIWVGGNNGLYRLKLSSDDLRPTRLDIGENRIVFSIAEDAAGILWLGTDQGLLQYNPLTNEVRLQDEEYGLENNEFNRRSILESNSGSIVAGSMGGVVYLNPEQITLNINEPNVWITGFRVTTPDTTLAYHPFGSEELAFNWEQNTFEIDFTSLNYTNPSQNQYKYQLQGFDPDWVDPGVIRQARYVQVPPGEYTFAVIASNNDGIWNEVGDSIRIKVHPPFWKTILFRLLVIVVIVLVGWLLYRFRIRQLLEVERVRLGIASDLHDEIGSGLSGIALTGDLLQSQSKLGTPRPEMIDRITNSARTLASSLDSIVWLIDPQKETLLDLTIKCKRTANELLAGHQLSIKDDIPARFHPVELPSEYRRSFYMVFKEVLHNIYKHAEADKVEVFLSVKDGKLDFLIKDDGKGFDEQKVLKGKGLDSMLKRASEIDALLHIHSEEGEGTVIKLEKSLP